MADTADVLSGVGALMSGTGALVGGIGSLSGTKKQIKEAAKRQKELMDYQNALNQANVEDQRRYITQYERDRYENYDSLQAQVRDAVAAGLNPEAVVGGSVGGSTGGASGASGVSIPGAPDIPNTLERFGSSISQVGESLMNGMRFTQEMKKAADESKARAYNLEALSLDNERNRVALDLERERLKDALFEGTRRAWNAYKQDSDYFMKRAAEFRARDAHDLSMRERNAEFDRNATRFDWEVRREEQEHAQRELQYWLSQEDLTEKRWRRQFREKYGVSPDKSMSLGDFLFRTAYQAVDGFSPSSPDSSVSGFKRDVRDLDSRVADWLGSFDRYISSPDMIRRDSLYNRSFDDFVRGLGRNPSSSERARFTRDYWNRYYRRGEYSRGR